MALKVAYKVDESLIKALDTITSFVRLDVLPKAFNEAGRVISRSFDKHLPDGNTGPDRGANSPLPSPTNQGTRKRQQKYLRERVFRFKMKTEIASKSKKYPTVAFKVVGTRDRVGQTHFDLYEKGLTVGREHVYWGKRSGVLRRQKVDVAEVVKVETQGQVRAIVERHVAQAIKEQFG